MSSRNFNQGWAFGPAFLIYNTETYQTTEEHPFLVVSAGWLPAKML